VVRSLTEKWSWFESEYDVGYRSCVLISRKIIEATILKVLPRRRGRLALVTKAGAGPAINVRVKIFLSYLLPFFVFDDMRR
jgi:hypothetical protein